MTQLDPVAMHLGRRHDVIAPEILRVIVGQKGVRITRHDRINVILLALVLLGLSGLVLEKGIMDSFASVPWLQCLIVLMNFCFALWAFWSFMKRSRFGKIKGAMLKCGCCPHCGYDLTGLPVDDTDGATVCPECGCAWSPAPK